jgi:2-polyprenyl-6-hydroxyphenyl methylase/3-demethylubiquinone-9 3-methyltransferase
MQNHNVDADEIAKFKTLASQWWDPNGQLRTLHDLNPIRLAFIQQYCQLNAQRVADIGCGGGILSESLAKNGAIVTAIDMDAAGIEVAKQHAQASQLAIDYRQQAVETLAEQEPASFDVVVCMEMLEHVPDPAAIMHACARLLKPQGKLLVSTINRHPKAYALAVIGAEYLLNLLPRGTHDYQKFIKPSELATWARQAGLQLVQMQGVHYQPFSRQCKLTDDVSVNYLACFEG